MTTAASFVTVRGQAISLETQTESLLSKYSTYAQTTSSEQSLQEKKIDNQIETILHRRQEVIDSLNKIANDNNISATKLTQLQRHKEILNLHWKNFQNIRSSIQQERNRLNLLFSVKNDIAQDNSTSSRTNEINNANEYIQNESRRIDQSHNILDKLITQAWETREQFSSQSSMLHSANNRILGALHRIPGLNQIITRIGIRRRKNTIILALVTTICILILFFTW